MYCMEIGKRQIKHMVKGALAAEKPNVSLSTNTKRAGVPMGGNYE